ncbi:hypothetical protein MN0502_12460 [Arthrobacter sp. MN05-02]|nr:hypothetical protein MN0502_12460 [Arthrobacter sp. MN05-02]
MGTASVGTSAVFDSCRAAGVGSTTGVPLAWDCASRRVRRPAPAQWEPFLSVAGGCVGTITGVPATQEQDMPVMNRDVHARPVRGGFQTYVRASLDKRRP